MISDRVLQAREDKSVRKAVAEIANPYMGVESRIKHTMDNALTGDKIRRAIQAVVTDALTQATVTDSLVDAIKDHDGYKQYKTDSLAPVPNASQRSMFPIYSRLP